MGHRTKWQVALGIRLVEEAAEMILPGLKVKEQEAGDGHCGPSRG